MNEFSQTSQLQTGLQHSALVSDTGSLLASMFASSSDCIKLLDLDGNLVFMTEVGQRIMEVTDFKQIRGCPWPDFWQGHGNAEAKAAILTARKGGSAQFTAFATTVAGTPKWWDVSVSAILDADGKPEKILSISRDITATRAAVEALETSERQHRLALRAGRLGHWSLALSSGELTASDVCKENFGRDTSLPFSYEDLRSSIHQDDIERVAAAIERTINTGDDYDIEYRIVRPDATVGWIMIRGQLVRDKAGKPEGMSGVSLDITRVKQAELVLTESEARFRSFAQALPNQVWSSTRDGSFDWFNEQVYNYTGLSAAQLKGFGWGEIVHPDDIQDAAKGWSDALDSGRMYETEFRIRRSDGSWRSHLVRAVPIKDIDNDVQRWIGTNTDIEDLKNAEVALLRSQQRASAALDAADIGTWELDASTGELVWDRRCYELFGLRDGAPMSFATFLAGVHPDDRRATEDACVAAMQADGTRFYDIEYRTVGFDDGVVRWVSAKGRSEFDGGQLVRFIGTVLDISKLKEAEAQRAMLTGELAHRIKNSMAMVSSIANQTFRSAATKEQAQVAFSSRLSALNTAHDILTATSWTSASMPHVVDRALAAHRTGEARISVHGPEVALTAKQALSLALALHELATNAVKYGSLSGEGGTVTVEWKISGVGPQEMLEFEWLENGGPPVSPPDKKGFGSRLIQATLSAEFGGTGFVEYRPAGLRAAFKTKLTDLANSGDV